MSVCQVCERPVRPRQRFCRRACWLASIRFAIDTTPGTMCILPVRPGSKEEQDAVTAWERYKATLTEGVVTISVVMQA